MLSEYLYENPRLIRKSYRFKNNFIDKLSKIHIILNPKKWAVDVLRGPVDTGRIYDVSDHKMSDRMKERIKKKARRNNYGVNKKRKYKKPDLSM